MYEINSLFFYKAQFMVELLVAETLFLLPLKRRKKFVLRALSSCLLLIGLAFAFPIFTYHFYYQSFMFFALALLSTLALFFCFDESFMNMLFVTVAGYSVQHLAYSIYQFVMVSTLLDGGESLKVYGSEQASLDCLSMTIYLSIYLIIYFFSYFLFGKLMKKQSDFYISNVWLFLLLIFFFISSSFLNSIMVEYCDPIRDQIPLIVMTVYSIINSILVITLQFKLKDEKKAKKELELIKHLWKEDKEHYELAKENISLINIKCHDLKHQIHNLNGGFDQKAIQEIEHSIMIYDSVTKTGNDALDVVLSEKFLFCKKNGISLTYIVDGEALSFISEYNIYSLFGNALDNAIEYLMQVKDPNQRFIRLNVKKINNSLLIHIENYYEGTIASFKDGLPRTTKGDENYHGFGLKSIERIAMEYNGQMFVKTQDSLFSLDILIPC